MTSAPTTDPAALEYRAAPPAAADPTASLPTAPPAQGRSQGPTAGNTCAPVPAPTAAVRPEPVVPVRRVGERAVRGADSSLTPATTEHGVEHEARILQILACTRVATPHQLHAWLTPTATDTSTVRKHLNRLKRAGLVAVTTERRPNVWFLTGTGLGEARRAGLAEPRTTAVTGEHVAASPAYAHALAVTDTAIAFSRRLPTEDNLPTALGEVGDWEVEVAHPLGAAGLLVPDAVLHLRYPELPHAFVEVDRATMSLGRLVTKVATYDRYRTLVPPRARTIGESVPDWWRRYPRAAGQHRFPPLLIVLAGKKADVLANRAADVLSGVATLRGVRSRQLAVGVATLADVQQHGALSAVWQTPWWQEPVRLARIVQHREPHSG
ncbi:replication-relaxation family protein [Streptomyces sp. NPDC001817]|uniref:replication-relaxation family protein n=1 Tax=Streptomyces sp. NPDC001817 TaxID=3154398 RepID=UPI0033184264